MINMKREQTTVRSATFDVKANQSSSMENLLCSSEVFLRRNSRSFLGRCLFQNRYSLSALLMKRGVTNAVMTETHTMIGYRKSSMTCRLMPRVATMNENSPIWTMLDPPRIAVCRVCPESRKPMVANTF